MTAALTAPSPRLLGPRNRVPARFEVQYRDDLGDWQPLAADVRLINPTQDALDALVDALAREHRRGKHVVRASATAPGSDGWPITAYKNIEPRFTRSGGRR